MDAKFQNEIKQKLKSLGPDNKIFLKKNYTSEVFTKHGITEREIDFIFDNKKIIDIYPNIAFPDERVDIEISYSKNKQIKVIIQFDPVLAGKKQEGKVGIVTAFKIRH